MHEDPFQAAQRRRPTEQAENDLAWRGLETRDVQAKSTDTQFFNRADRKTINLDSPATGDLHTMRLKLLNSKILAGLKMGNLRLRSHWQNFSQF
jgi:hypothetical protein